MKPLPFYSLVRTRGPGSHVDPNKPLGLGVVLGRSEGPDGWGYAVGIGEISYSFGHDELIPLGCVVDRLVIYGTDAEIEGRYGRLVSADVPARDNDE